MTTPKPEVVAEYIADQIAGDFTTVRGPVEDVFIEGDVDLVEVAKALMDRFDITERRLPREAGIYTEEDSQ